MYKRQGLTDLNASAVASGTAQAIQDAAAALEEGSLQVFAGPLHGVASDGEVLSLGAVSYTHLDVYKRQLLVEQGAEVLPAQASLGGQLLQGDLLGEMVLQVTDGPLDAGI